MVSSQFHYTKRNRFMPFLLAEILNFQGSTHHIGVGSFSKILKNIKLKEKTVRERNYGRRHEYMCRNIKL